MPDAHPLAEGCYFLAYGIDEDIWYEGTLRVERPDGDTFASGDLYAVTARTNALPPIGFVPPRGPGIPIFPIADYTYYFRATRIAPVENGFDLTFEAHRFLPRVVKQLDGAQTDQWALEGSYTARMMPATAPAGYPAADRFFVGDVSVGDVFDETHLSPTFQIQLGWVSPFLRAAVIEIDRVPDVNVPHDNYAGVNWQSVFRSFGWDLRVIVSDNDVTKTGCDPLWHDFDADAAMHARRDSSDLDVEWRFYILVAPEISAPGSDFGFMYHPRREAMLIASQHVFPENDLKWGALRGERLDTTVAFFRTAVHEMGHAMSLLHNETGFHFMRPTAVIAAEAPAEAPFPANIDWSFSPENARRLRHWPDIAVRPGGPRDAAGGLPLPGDPPAARPSP